MCGDLVARDLPGQELAQLFELQALGLEQLRDLLTGEIARYKIPAHLRTVEELPLTPSGKVQKFKLKELFASESEAVDG